MNIKLCKITAFIKKGLSLTHPKVFKQRMEDTIPNASIGYSIIVFFDCYICVLLYGSTVNDYFDYRFFEKKRVIRKKYITTLGALRIEKRINSEKYIECFRDKIKFNESFKDYRDIEYFTFNHSREEFETFARKNNYTIIFKPASGTLGQGIYIPDISTKKLRDIFYNRWKEHTDCLCESVFQQAELLNKVHPYSVNTIRVCTLRNKDHIDILFTGIKFGGNHKCVDNVHAGGLSCEIEKTTGIIIGKGYDFLGNVFVNHPLSGIMLVGIQIPNWEKVISLAKACALKTAEARYVGWDIAVGDDTVSVIEGNEDASMNLIQVCKQTGIKEEICKYLSEII